MAYHSKTYLPSTLKKLFGEKTQNLQDITHGQTHQKNQDLELGFLSVLTKNTCVTVSPSPQSKDEENEKLHKLRRYARDFRRQHTTDAKRFNWDSDDEDYGLAIGRLVVT
jgi:hypothetical protein